MKHTIIQKAVAGFVVAALLTGSLIGLSACSNSTANQTNADSTVTTGAATKSAAKTDTDSAAAAAPATETKKDYGTLSVSFPTGNIRIAINILALQLGYFEEEGVTVEPVNIVGNNALTAINEDSSQLDVLAIGFVADLQALASGYDLSFIAGTAVEGGALIAKKGNAANFRDADNIIDIDAVLDAKLGFVRNEAAWIITRQYLLDNGVSADVIAAIEDESTGNITYYGQETETAQAVQKGEIDIGFLPLEYALLYADAYDLEVITSSGALQPNYVCCREVTSPTKIAEKRDAFIAYETARIRAFEYYKQGETDETVRQNVIKIVTDYSGKEPSYVETYLYGGVTKYSTDPNLYGIQKYVIAAYNSGALSSSEIDFGTYDISQNVDTSVYKEALDNLIAKEPDNAFYAELSELYTASNEA